MQVMLCQIDLILLHKWGLDDSQLHTTVALIYLQSMIDTKKVGKLALQSLTLIKE